MCHDKPVVAVTKMKYQAWAAAKHFHFSIFPSMCHTPAYRLRMSLLSRIRLMNNVEKLTKAQLRRQRKLRYYNVTIDVKCCWQFHSLDVCLCLLFTSNFAKLARCTSSGPSARRNARACAYICARGKSPLRPPPP